MDIAETERELEDLESRIERLRALYEQYFLGIEKLEPQIQRKDVDRRVVILRREQIRNTGLRFKFQMLVQRFNTMQQYWQRVTREIENGTYRRDVIRAASRVGAKEALTIVGKKRAAQYERLMVAQQERLGKRQAQHVEEEVLEEAELVDDEDDAPTPPSRKVDLPPAQVIAPVIAPAPGLGWPRVAAPAATATKSFGLRLGGSRPNAPAPAADLDFGAGAETRPPEPVKPDPDAVKRRVAALAAQMRAPKMEPAKQDFGALDLELEDEAPNSKRRTGKSVRPPPPAPTPSPVAQARRPGGGFGEIKLTDDLLAPNEASALQRTAPAPPREAAPMRSLAAPIGRPPGFQARPLPPPEAASSPMPRASSPLQPIAPVAQRTQPEPRPAPQPRSHAPAAPPPGATPGELDDKRMRQIYAKYVETKRASNESTAGVTFEKLASSLRAQADKLRAQHKKNVDYEVIVKDGKTILKPILR